MTAAPAGRFEGSPGEAPDAVILCAGRGERLRPLTDHVQKVLAPIGDTVLLGRHLEALERHGVRRVVLVVNYLAETVEAYVRTHFAGRFSFEFVTQPVPHGTGDALLQASPKVTTDPFLVGYGDVFFSNPDQAVDLLLRGTHPKMLGALVEDGSPYGRLITQDHQDRHLLIEIREKDGIPKPGLINAGWYLLPRAVLPLLEVLPPSPRGEVELTDAVSGFVNGGGTVEVIPVHGWLDVGTPESLSRADALARKPG